MHFSQRRELRSLLKSLKRNAPIVTSEAAGGPLWADGRARGTAREVLVHVTVLDVEAA
jgi:hypothetical protein